MTRRRSHRHLSGWPLAPQAAVRLGHRVPRIQLLGDLTARRKLAAKQEAADGDGVTDLLVQLRRVGATVPLVQETRPSSGPAPANLARQKCANLNLDEVPITALGSLASLACAW